MRRDLQLASLLSVLLFCAMPKVALGQQASGTTPTEKPSDGRKADPDAPPEAAMNNGGDPKRGQALFASATTTCATCHKVRGQGGDLGPDLSQIGGKFDRTHLIESILDPSAEI